MIKLPSLPDPDSVLSVFDKASNAIDRGLSFIGKIESKLDRFVGPESQPTRTTPSTIRVTDQQTLAYQLNHIIAPLRQLELHLAEKGRISGVPCDCIAKAAMDVAIFSEETIPIAARQGANAKFYDDLADWSRRIGTIGNEEAVRSGKHDGEYLTESGTASKYRKKVQTMLSELGSQPECPTCEKVETLKEHLEKRKKEGSL